MIITLIGMPGSGKTTIGKHLKKYNWTIIDTDNLIENYYNKKLIDIVNKYKHNFINIEKNIILNLNLNKSKHTIISTGGSVIFSEDIMNYLQKHSKIIYLNVTPNELEKRIHNFYERGIIMNANDTIYDIYNKRNNLYKKYSDITIENNNIFNTINIINNYK